MDSQSRLRNTVRISWFRHGATSRGPRLVVLLVILAGGVPVKVAEFMHSVVEIAVH